MRSAALTKIAEKQMPISVTERKKAEELIEAQFKDLRDEVEAAVDEKIADLKERWSKHIGLAKLQSQLAKKNEEAEALKEKIAAITGNNYCHEDCGPPKTGALGVALKRLDAEHEKVKLDLRKLERTATKSLWFGMLASDALKILNGIPEAKQIFRSGLGSLRASAKTLLG